MPNPEIESSERLIAAAAERLVESAPSLFNGQKVLSLNRREVRKRPLSCVAWVDLVLPDGPRRLVIKTSTGDTPEKIEKARRRLEREFRTARKFEQHTGLGIVKMSAFFSDLPALVMEEIQGHTLYDLVARKAACTNQELQRICFAAGEWLKVFQRSTVQPDRRMCLDDMIQYVDLRLKLLTEFKISGVDSNWRSTILSTFHSAGERIKDPEFKVSCVHGDFAPSNVLYSGGRIVVTDFASFEETGSVYYDLTRFHHQLGLFLKKPSLRNARIIPCLRAALLKGYDDTVDETSDLFRLFTIQHLVCHWLGRLKLSEKRLHKRAYNRWVCYQHKRQLDDLVRRTNDDVV